MHTTSTVTCQLTPHLAAARWSSRAAKPRPPQPNITPDPAKGGAAAAKLTKAVPTTRPVPTIAKHPGVPSGPKVAPNRAPLTLVSPKPSPTDTPAPQVQPTLTTEKPQEQSPLDALLADWGKADSPYDLNGDGTVDAQDLAILLAGYGQDDTPSIKPVPSDDLVSHPQPSLTTEEPQEQSPLDALLADWGKADSPYDLNGDGTVDAHDLAILLTQQGAPPNRPHDPTPNPGALARKLTEAIFASQDRNHDGLITEKDLGGRNHLFRRIDRDGDGVISPKDLHRAIMHSLKTAMGRKEALNLAKFAQQWLAVFNRHEEVGRAAKRTHIAPSLRAVQNRAAAEHIARSLLQRAATSGPSEIRQAVDKSNLAEDHKRLILDRIAAWSPRGLNVSLVG